jgi:hypothetical protein
MKGELCCTTVGQADVLGAIVDERSYQDHKWGTPREHPHDVGGYLTLMRVHLTKAEAAWAGSRGDENALDALRKVVAIGVACFEQHGVPLRVWPQPDGNNEAWRESGSKLA